MMDASRENLPYLIVGAGSSGLPAAKHLRAAGVPVEVIEREDDVGGNWYYGNPHSSVYASTHLISSKRMTEYADFPMPKAYPPYPHHKQVLAYLRAYADEFDLRPLIRFRTSVERLERSEAGWQAELSGGETRQYSGVVVANGHNWDPRWPEISGEFAGKVLHSAEYKTPDVLRGKRVLVVGAGNSGCDIAVEAAQNAAVTFHSTRRGYHYVPKFVRGKPADVVGEWMLRWRLPLWLRRLVTRGVVKIALGSPQDYGLPKPDHRLFETHPIINSQLLYFVGHGDIRPKPDVTELCGDKVRFADGTEELIDLIVYATGFKISFPFLDRKYLNWQDGRPGLYLNVFHPEYDDLFFVGLIQPDSGQFGLVDEQARLIARFVAAVRSKAPAAANFRRRKAGRLPKLGRGIRYIDSPRHLLEVEHFSYRRRLEKEIARFELPPRTT